jgi:predicted outer membrane protein
MAFAASSALIAARASNMAEARGTTSKMRKYATKVIGEQTGIGAQLSFAGRRIDLLPSSRPIPQHQAMLEELATSADFGGTYLRLMDHVLTEAAKAHRNFEASGESPTLRQVAVFAAPVCERHLADLRKL